MKHHHKKSLNGKVRIRLTKIEARIYLDWEPSWDPEISGWAGKFIDKHKYKIDPIYEFEDLIQEAYCKYLLCIERYPQVVVPRHFMALFKSALFNHFFDLARVYRDKQNNSVLLEEDLSVFENTLKDENILNGYQAVVLSEMPIELKTWLLSYFNNEDLQKFRASYSSSGDVLSQRESFNDRIRRITGMGENLDLYELMRVYLTTSF